MKTIVTKEFELQVTLDDIIEMLLKKGISVGPGYCVGVRTPEPSTGKPGELTLLLRWTEVVP